MIPNLPSIPTFWWNGVPNFGDLLNPPIFEKYGINLVRSEVNNAQLVGIGSNLQGLPESFSGHIFGGGIISASDKASLPNAKFHAVRGALTRDKIGLPKNIPLGDPAILIDNPETPKKYDYGIVPHYIDYANPEVARLKSYFGDHLLIVDVTNPDPSIVIDQIASCRVIASSSLHGLIVAWALGIPAGWIYITDGVIGDGFKFRDFFSTTGIGLEQIKIQSINDWFDFESICRLDPTNRINELKDGLINAIGQLRKELYEKGVVSPK